jgi:hypothetical protein
MHLRRWPFRLPCGGVEAIHAALPDAACPGLHRKPLDVTIGQLLALYRLGGRQGGSKQKNDVINSHFDGRFDGHCNAAVLYRPHCPKEEVKAFIL